MAREFPFKSDQCRLYSQEQEPDPFYNSMPEVVSELVASCGTKDCFDHVNPMPLPSRQAVVSIIDQCREILFPGYFNSQRLDLVNLSYHLGQAVLRLYQDLSTQITNAVRHDCYRYEKECEECAERGRRCASRFMKQLPELRAVLASDVRAAYAGDPAAGSLDEIIFSYPGLYAITVYRLAHLLYEMGVPLLPRIMTEYAHSHTGIDLHPAAQIGESFFIDHGTGVVVGGTAVIGKRVRLYQGVTLGALSLPSEQVEQLRGEKRHPTLEDEVIIYAGATILGGDTVIGTRSVIGGNVWLTESVPPDSKVLIKKPELVIRGQG